MRKQNKTQEYTTYAYFKWVCNKISNLNLEQNTKKGTVTVQHKTDNKQYKKNPPKLHFTYNILFMQIAHQIKLNSKEIEKIGSQTPPKGLTRKEYIIKSTHSLLSGLLGS